MPFNKKNTEFEKISSLNSSSESYRRAKERGALGPVFEPRAPLRVAQKRVTRCPDLSHDSFARAFYSERISEIIAKVLQKYQYLPSNYLVISN